MILRSLRVEGPIELERPNPLRRRFVTRELPVDDPAAQRECATQILRRSGRLLYRRPLADDELASLLALFDEGQSEDESSSSMPATRLALEAMLLSPHFLFRVELRRRCRQLSSHSLGPYELAARFRTSCGAAPRRDPCWMLPSAASLPRMRGCRRSFVACWPTRRPRRWSTTSRRRWLLLRQIDRAEPDATQFPAFTSDAAPGAASRRDAALRERLLPRARGPTERARPALTQLLTARFTDGSAEVARHHGLTEAAGQDFVACLRRHDATGPLTQGSLLTAESYPTRTSPVRRGKWVLEQLLCTPPPPPPPNVIGDFGQPGSGGTLRQRLEAAPTEASVRKLSLADGSDWPVAGRLRRHRPRPQHR